MHVKASQIFKKLTGLAMISITLWLGGFGCSACCVTEKIAQADNEKLSFTQNPSSTEPASPTEECCRGSNCCQKSKRKAVEEPRSEAKVSIDGNSTTPPVALQISPEGGVAGCSLLPRNVTSETFSKRFADTVDVVAEPTALTFNLVTSSRNVQFIPPGIPQNRSGTHLRCCALLI